MNWILSTTKGVDKSLESFPHKDYEHLKDALDQMSVDPFSGDIVKLGESDGWRRRVGNYRIKFVLDKDRGIIEVYKIERRTSTMYRKGR